MPPESDAWSPSAQRQRAVRLAPADVARRQALASVLAAYNRSIGGSAEAAERLASREALVVAAVVDPAPLLGPMRHLLASVGVLRWARDAQALLGRPTVPVAVLLPPARGAAYVVGRDGRLVRFAAAEAPTAAAFRRTAGPMLSGLEQVLGRPWPLARQTLEAAEGLADWTARLLAGVCGPHGLVVADALQAPLLDAMPPLYPRLLFWRASLGLGEERLMFVRCGRPVAAAAGGAGALAAEAVAHPRRFRPGREAMHLFLDQLLPLLGLVVEPHESASLRALLLRTGRRGTPLVRERPRCTLVPGAVGAFARANRIPVEAGPAAFRHARDEALGALCGIDPRQAVRRLTADVDRRVAEWEEDVAGLLPDAAPAIARRRRGTLRALERLENELGQALRRRHRTLAQAWRQAQGLLYPLDGPQDETLAAAALLVPGGPRLVERLLAAAVGPGRHFLDGL